MDPELKRLLDDHQAACKNCKPARFYPDGSAELPELCDEACAIVTQFLKSH